MGAQDWWTEALGTFKDSPYEYLSAHKGKVFGIDTSIILYKKFTTDADKYSATSIPQYRSGNLLQSFIAFHTQLTKWIIPFYVFD